LEQGQGLRERLMRNGGARRHVLARVLVPLPITATAAITEVVPASEIRQGGGAEVSLPEVPCRGGT
jgi:hypothetical protein